MSTAVRKSPIAVFASGSGTNLQALLDYGKAHTEWPAKVALVVSDKPQCLAVERARQSGVPVFAGEPRGYADKAAFEADVLQHLRQHDVEWLVLAGYMRLVGPALLHTFPNRILNIHPSLLPHFPGRTAVRDALAAGVAKTGVTVHLVDEGIDTGQVIAQVTVPIPAGMTEAELLVRVHQVEHELYPATVSRVLSEWKTAGQAD